MNLRCTNLFQWEPKWLFLLDSIVIEFAKVELQESVRKGRVAGITFIHAIFHYIVILDAGDEYETEYCHFCSWTDLGET